MKRPAMHRLVTSLALSLVVAGLHTSALADQDSPAGVRRLKTMLELASTLKETDRDSRSAIAVSGTACALQSSPAGTPAGP